MSALPNSNPLVLQAWSKDGRLVAHVPISKRALAFSSAGECDCVLKELGEDNAFLSVKPQGLQFLYQQKDRSPVSLTLELGRTLQMGSLNWMVVSSNLNASRAPSASVAPQAEQSDNCAAYQKSLLEWLRLPMASANELRAALKNFLSLTLDHTGAMYGLVVLARDDGFDLIAAEGMNESEAQALWEKMPEQLTAELLRNKAKILLPEGLRDKTNGKSTVFMRHVRSVVGFPAMAEQKVFALFYLGYRNLLSELSPDWQLALENASDLLGLTLQRAALRQETSSLRHELSAKRESHASEHLMIGQSAALSNAYRLIKRLANFGLPILVQGETGTGKELAVRELHRFSERSSKPFVAVNAAALPENLIESELFGFKKGAFTGALTDRVGLIEQADGGTLFIDEIGELPLPLQAKLLRAIQEKSVTRLGENKARAVDFRLVAATHRDLKMMVCDKAFREDLYFRIAGAIVELPPLRERREDIVPLARYFVSRFARAHFLEEKDFSAPALKSLENHPWPGNIRELENVVQRAFVMSEGPVIERADLGIDDTSQDEPENGVRVLGTDFATARDDWMRSYIVDALRRNGGNRAETAKELGIGQRTLFRYLDQLQIRGE